MTRRIALLVDFDNAQIAASDEEFKNCAAPAVWARPLVKAVEEQCGGQVDIRRVYGNTLHHVQGMLRSGEWNPKNLRDKMDLDVNIQTDLSRHGFQAIHCPTGAGRKNRADILMALDCIEIAVNYSHIDTFAILSHDSDFSALIQRLRAIGKQVAVVSVGKREDERSRSLTALANFRITCDQKAIDECGRKPLIESLEELSQPDGFPAQGVAVDALRVRIRERLNDFHHNDLGFFRLQDFVSECVDGTVYRVKDGRVIVNGSATAVSKPTAEVKVRAMPPSGISPNLEKAKLPMTDLLQEQRLKARSALTARDIRFHSSLRESIMSHIRRLLCERSEGDPYLTYGALQDSILALPSMAEHSKSKVRDSLKVLKFSGALVGEYRDGCSIKDQPIVSCRSDEATKQCLARYGAEALVAAGITVGDVELSVLAELVFGEDGDVGRSQINEWIK